MHIARLKGNILEDLYLASGLRDLDLESDLPLFSLRSVVGEVNWVGWELELLIIDYHWIEVCNYI